MKTFMRFKDTTLSRKYSEELIAERKLNKRSLTVIFVASTLFYMVDIVVSKLYLGSDNLPYHEMYIVLTLLLLRVIGFFLYFKYEKSSDSKIFKVFELAFVVLFSATTLLTWNTEINMDLSRSYVVGLDAGWILRYTLILFGQWKFKALLDASVMLFGIVKLIMMDGNFNIGFVQAGLQIVYALMLIYSREKVQKINFLKTSSLKKTQQTLKNILDNIPENIAVLDLEGDMIYFNEYLDICFGISDQAQDEIDLFSKFFSIRPRERYFNFNASGETGQVFRLVRRKTTRKLPIRKLTLTPLTPRQKGEARNPHLKEENDFTIRKQNILPKNNKIGYGPTGSKIKNSQPSLTEVISTIENFNNLQDVIDFFVMNIDNLRNYSNKANNFFIFDSKYKEREDSSPKSYEIKISLASFDGNESFILILRDTTHRDIIATLESNNNYKDSVLSSISHELRTPLNTNLNMLEIAIKDNGASTSLKDDFLIPAHQSGKLLQSLINDILDYSMSLADKLTMNCKFKSLIKTLDKVRYLVEPQAKRKGLGFKISIASNITQKVATDHKRLRQILINLLSNALKFTLRGEISLYVEYWGLDEKIIKFSVCDTGIGMTEQAIDHMRSTFEKNTFGEKLTDSAAGSGIGLMMSQMLIKAIGPKITKLSGLKFDSRIHEGSTFWFFIDSREKPNLPSSAHMEVSTNSNLLIQRELNKLRSTPNGQQQMYSTPKSILEKSMNFDTSSPLLKLTEMNHKNKQFSTLTTKDPQDNFFLNDGEATLGEDDQYEEERACMIKDNNLVVNRNNSDSSDSDNNRSLRPRLLSNNLQAILSKPGLKESLSKIESSQMVCQCAPILVADDDVFNLFTMKSLMKSFGLCIDEAHNGSEAVEAVTKRFLSRCSPRCQVYKLILMDLSMPVMDGFEATLKLREMISKSEIPYIPIIACTAFVDTDKTEKCYKYGMEGRISKPVSKNKLQEILKNYNIPFVLN